MATVSPEKATSIALTRYVFFFILEMQQLYNFKSISSVYENCHRNEEVVRCFFFLQLASLNISRTLCSMLLYPTFLSELERR